MIKLTLTEKGGEPKVLTFDKDEITIGRVSGNDIVLAKGNISKRHSRLTMRSGEMEIADLKSTNGTYVNGRKISGPTPIAASDRVYVGDFLIGIEGPGGAPAGFADFSDAPPSSGAMSTSAARHLPPPPPPPRSGSAASRLPIEEDDDDGDSSSSEDEEELGLAARPPRAARPIPPPPPPPPPRRPATPLASRSLDVDDDDGGFGGVSVEEGGGLGEDTGNVGLFQHNRRTGEEDGEATGGRRATGARPGVGAVTSPQTPSFAAAGPAAAAAAADTSGGSASALEALLADTAVTHILITAPDAALVDRGSGLVLHDASLGDANAVADVLWRYANTAYPPPPPDNPVVDVRLPDGTRVSAAFPPTVSAGVIASIRRPTLPERQLVDLVPGGNKDIQTLLDALIATRRNVMVTGDTSALPSVLAAFSRDIPADRRVVAIGASARARSGWIDLAPTGDAAGLLRVAAALRPDHLVVGELSGTEAAELVLVATRGQQGVLLAMPGRSAAEALNRFSALAAPGLGAAATAASLVASTFDLVIQVVAAPDAGARIIEVGEPRAAGNEVAIDVSLSIYNEGSKRDPAGGRLQGRGISARLGSAMASAGSTVPSSLVGK